MNSTKGGNSKKAIKKPIKLACVLIIVHKFFQFEVLIKNIEHEVSN